MSMWCGPSALSALGYSHVRGGVRTIIGLVQSIALKTEDCSWYASPGVGHLGLGTVVTERKTILGLVAQLSQ